MNISIEESQIQDAIAQLASRYPEHSPEELRAGVERWLQSSVEGLLEDAEYHLSSGDRGYAFNRRSFERAIQ